MKFFRIIVFGVIGLGLGIGLFLLDNSGFFERWQSLSNPSNELQNLFSDDNFPESYPGLQYITPCNPSSPELFLFWNPPKNISNCVQRIDREADAYTRSTFIMDNTGNIWMWSHFWYAYYEYVSRVLFPAIGSIIGIIIAFLVNRLKTKQNRPTRTRFAGSSTCSGRLGLRAFSGRFRGRRLIPSKRRYLVPSTSAGTANC